MDDEDRKRAMRNGEAREAEQDRPAQSSAMVIVLGLVSLLSLVIGFILGKIF